MTAEFTANQLAELESYASKYIVMEVSMNNHIDFPLDSVQSDVVKFAENGKVASYASYPVGMSNFGIPMIKKLVKFGYLEGLDTTSNKGLPITIYSDTQKFTNLMVQFAQPMIDQMKQTYEVSMAYYNDPAALYHKLPSRLPRVRGY